MTHGNSVRLAVTPGEPAGIGPEVLMDLVSSKPYLDFRQKFRQRFDGQECDLVAIADRDLLKERAGLSVRESGRDIQITPCKDSPARDNELFCHHIPLAVPCIARVTDPLNARYVLATLKQAVDGCMSGEYQAMVTGPVNKAVINEGGTPFTGHTEWVAERTGAPKPVMMLATEGLRVAFATTHLPLREVSDAITVDLLLQVIRILDHDLREKFGIDHPRILVCGLNPHAGEAGHLGHEEMEVIEPALATLVNEGINLRGPIPADTVFTPHNRSDGDVILSMYHDQGGTPLKQIGFGKSVNITLGLPIIRTSVDHGTALDLAGTGKADTGSLLTAIQYACVMAKGEDGWL